MPKCVCRNCCTHEKTKEERLEATENDQEYINMRTICVGCGAWISDRVER